MPHPCGKQPSQRVRLSRTFMSARPAFEDQRVLAKLIAQFVDMKSPRASQDCYEPERRRPSSTRPTATMYKEFRHRSPNPGVGQPTTSNHCARSMCALYVTAVEPQVLALVPALQAASGPDLADRRPPRPANSCARSHFEEIAVRHISRPRVNSDQRNGIQEKDPT